MRFSILFFTLCLSISGFSQQNYTVSGYIHDASSGENLVGVTIYVPQLSKGSTTNTYGYYTLNLPAGKHKVHYSYLGYKTKTLDMMLDGDKQQTVELFEESITLEVVEVKANDESKKVLDTQMGTETISLKMLKKLPSMMGEADIMKNIQLMPGIQSQSEGSSGFNVRGGNYDQNLVLLDEAVVYNPGHIFGFFSVFNDDAIKSATVNKGDMPANYGGRLSSVVDIVSKEGNNKTFQGKVSIGLLSSKLTIEGPIVKDKCSFIVSARRMNLDLLAKPLMAMAGRKSNNVFYFYDLNAKVNYKFSHKDRLYLSLYQGKDVFKIAIEDNRFSWELPWGNATSTLRWNHLFGDKLFMNVSLIQNSFFRDFNSIQEGFEEKKHSKVNDYGLKVDLTYFTPFDHKIKIGAQGVYHKFRNDAGDEVNVDRYATEISGYILDEFSVTSRLLFNIGLRYSTFQHIGNYNEYVFDEDQGAVQLVRTYKKHEHIKSYSSLEPRLSARVLINNNTSFKASYTKNSQYMHLISNSGATLPFDMWIHSSKFIKPQRSSQYALGLFYNLKDKGYQLSLEAFYKELENQIDFSERFVPDFTNNSEFNYVFGDGKAQGIELSFKKLKGKISGGINYTLSESKRQFDELNFGKDFYDPNDVRHDLSISGTYTLNKKWSFGAVFVYRTGKPFTIPVGRYFASGEIIDQYGERNNYRLPAYNRLDISANYFPDNKKKKFDREWVFAIYNVYNQYNPTYIYFSNEGSVKDNTFKTQAKTISLIPIMPSVTWRIKFN